MTTDWEKLRRSIKRSIKFCKQKKVAVFYHDEKTTDACTAFIIAFNRVLKNMSQIRPQDKKIKRHRLKGHDK